MSTCPVILKVGNQSETENSWIDIAHLRKKQIVKSTRIIPEIRKMERAKSRSLSNLDKAPLTKPEKPQDQIVYHERLLEIGKSKL